MNSHAHGLPVCLAIDTNVLLLLLGYRCLLLTGATGPERHRLLNDIRQQPGNVPAQNFDNLWQLFHGAARRIVTEHVIAETYGSRKRLKSLGNRKDIVWSAALTLLVDPGIEEASCRVGEMQSNDEYRGILTKLGPADTGLLYTAEERRATIITEDYGLAGLARSRSVRAVSLWEIPTFQGV